MDYVIHTYGGHAELIWEVFNGMAMLFASKSSYFTVVGKLSMTVGAVWAATRAIAGANIGIFGKQWFAPAFLSFALLFSPKVQVQIRDEARSMQYTVDNIPFAVAFFSSLPSKISYYLSKQIEEKLDIADKARSSNGGLMFGAKLVSQFKYLTVQDPVLLDNAKNFSKQCFLRPWIMGNILGKRKEAEEIMEWLRNNKANNFGLYYKSKDGGVSFKACVDVTEEILSGIEAEAKSSKVLASLGLATKGTNEAVEELARRMINTGQDALKVLSASTEDVHKWVRQSMMLNVYRESLDDWRESAGYQRLWPEAISMNATRGLYQQSIGWMTVGEMSAQFLPLLQTILFLIIVCTIFVVFPMAMLPGGFEGVKLWVRAMIWVQTWPIFFAIINCIGMKILSSRITGYEDDFGMGKLSQGQFSDMLIHTYAMVQMFAALVPVFSWTFLSKSAYAFSSMVDRFAPMSTGAALGAATVDNTLSMDNVSYGGRQIGQKHIGPNLDMSSSINTGAVRVTQSADGREFIAQSASSLAHNYRGSQMESQAINDSYSQQSSHMQALNDRSSSLASTEQGQVQDYAQRWLESHDASLSGNERIANSMRIAASEGISSSEGFGDKYNKGTDTHTSADISGRASSEKSAFGKILTQAAGVDFNASLTTGTGARNSTDISKDSSVQQNKQYLESLDQVRDYVKTHDLKDGSGTSNTLSDNLQNTWREQEQVSRDIASTSQTMENLQKQLSHVEQNQSSIDSNWNDQVLETVAARHGLINKQEALSYLESHQGEGEAALRDIVGAKYGRKVSGALNEKGASLRESVSKDLSSSPDVMPKAKERLFMKHEEKKGHDEFKARVEGNIIDANSGQFAQKATQSSVGFAEEMKKKGIGGKMEVGEVQQKTQADLDGKREKFDKTFKSTVRRTAEEANDNSRDAIEGFWRFTKKGIKSLSNLGKKGDKN